MKIKLPLLAVVCAACYSTTVIASEQKSNIETISVIGSRSPVDKATLAGSTSFIDADTIAASGASSITDLLRSFASINISQSGPTGTLTEIRFRGSESNHILVLVDGVEVNDIGQGGLVDFAHLLVSDIERIELLRGPQSALWGSSAVSGVISITSKQASNLGEHKLSSRAGIGTQATRQIGVSYKTRQQDLTLSVNLNHLGTEGSNISRIGDEKDGYHNTTFSSIVAYEFNEEHKVTLNARLVEYTTDFDATDFYISGLSVDADNESKGKQANALVRWNFAPNNSSWSQSLSFQINRLASNSFSSNAFSGGTIGKTQRITWLNYVDFGANDFINIGIDNVQEDFEQSGPIAFGNPNQTQKNRTFSLLSDGQFELANELYASFSLRSDQSDAFDDADSFRLGLSYVFGNNFKAFISRGKAIKNPTFTERFGFFPGTFFGNSELTPESSYANEVGVSFGISDNVNADITHFNTKLENEINGFVFDPLSSGFTAKNISETSTRKGLEVSLNGDWDAVNWAVSYAYLDAKAPTEVELRRARHSGSASVNYSLNAANNLYIQADYNGKKRDRFYPPYPRPSEIIELEQYWLVSANYQYKHNEELSFSLRIENLLNERFEDVVGFVGQSRKVVLSVQYQLN
jgi:vitamin B12 transporter